MEKMRIKMPSPPPTTSTNRTLLKLISSLHLSGSLQTPHQHQPPKTQTQTQVQHLPPTPTAAAAAAALEPAAVQQVPPPPQPPTAAAANSHGKKRGQKSGKRRGNDSNHKSKPRKSKQTTTIVGDTISISAPRSRSPSPPPPVISTFQESNHHIDSAAGEGNGSDVSGGKIYYSHSIIEIRNVGPKRAKILANERIHTIGDIMTLTDEQLVDLDAKTLNANLKQIRKDCIEYIDRKLAETKENTTAAATSSSENQKDKECHHHHHPTAEPADADASHSWFGKKVSCFLPPCGQIMVQCKVGKLETAPNGMWMFNVEYRIRNTMYQTWVSPLLLACQCGGTLGRNWTPPKCGGGYADPASANILKIYNVIKMEIDTVMMSRRYYEQDMMGSISTLVSE